MFECERLPPEYTEEVLTEDFENLRGRSGGGSADAGACSANVNMKLNMDVVDGASSFTLKKKTVDIEKLRKSFTNRYVSVSLSVGGYQTASVFQCFLSVRIDM